MALWTNVRRVVGLAALGAAMVLGGCGASQNEMDALRSENEDLRGRIASCESSNREKDTRIAELESTRNTIAATPAYQPMQPISNPTPAFTGGGSDNDGFRREGNNMVLDLAGEVLFDSGQATLKSSAKKELDRLAKVLNGRFNGRTVRVEGHTDRQPIRKSKFASNDALSEARADAVRSYLVSKGVSSSRLSAIGFGSSKPKSTDKDSRRVEVVVVGG